MAGCLICKILLFSADALIGSPAVCVTRAGLQQWEVDAIAITRKYKVFYLEVPIMDELTPNIQG